MHWIPINRKNPNIRMKSLDLNDNVFNKSKNLELFVKEKANGMVTIIFKCGLQRAKSVCATKNSIF